MEKIKFKKILLLFTIIIFVISCDFVENKTINVPKILLQSKIKKKFPMTKEFLVGNITLTDPKVDFKDDKMYIETYYHASLIGTNGNYGKMFISTKIKYDVNKENMYLVDFSFDKILDKDGKEVIGFSKDVEAVKKIISSFMAINPVYEYRKENPKAKVKIKNMYIKNGNFYVQT